MKAPQYTRELQYSVEDQAGSGVRPLPGRSWLEWRASWGGNPRDLLRSCNRRPFCSCSRGGASKPPEEPQAPPWHQWGYETSLCETLHLILRKHQLIHTESGGCSWTWWELNPPDSPWLVCCVLYLIVCHQEHMILSRGLRQHLIQYGFYKMLPRGLNILQIMSSEPWLSLPF